MKKREEVRKSKSGLGLLGPWRKKERRKKQRKRRKEKKEEKEEEKEGKGEKKEGEGLGLACMGVFCANLGFRC